MKVMSSEFETDLELYAEKAMSEPVTITSDGQDWLVLLSWEQYARLTQINRRMQGLEDLSDAEIDDVLAQPYGRPEQGPASEKSAELGA